MIASALNLSAESVPRFFDGNPEEGDAVAKRRPGDVSIDASPRW